MIWYYDSMHGQAALSDSDTARGDEKMAVESLPEVKLSMYTITLDPMGKPRDTPDLTGLSDGKHESCK